MNYTYYQPQLHQSLPVPKSFTRSSIDVVIGALLLISPMFWLFIAELVK